MPPAGTVPLRRRETGAREIRPAPSLWVSARRLFAGFPASSEQGLHLFKQIGARLNEEQAARVGIVQAAQEKEGAAAQVLFRVVVGQPLVQQTVQGLLVDQDRKSTRLNSSHVAISSAVFCLKKKE